MSGRLSRNYLKKKTCKLIVTAVYSVSLWWETVYFVNDPIYIRLLKFIIISAYHSNWMIVTMKHNLNGFIKVINMKIDKVPN